MIDKPVVLCLDAKGYNAVYHCFATKEDAEKYVTDTLPQLSKNMDSYTVTYGLMTEMYKYEKTWSKTNEYVVEVVPPATAKALEI